MHADESVAPDHPAAPLEPDAKVEVLEPAVERQLFVEPNLPDRAEPICHLATIERPDLALDMKRLTRRPVEVVDQGGRLLVRDAGAVDSVGQEATVCADEVRIRIE